MTAHFVNSSLITATHLQILRSTESIDEQTLQAAQRGDVAARAKAVNIWNELQRKRVHDDMDAIIELAAKIMELKDAPDEEAAMQIAEAIATERDLPDENREYLHKVARTFSARSMRDAGIRMRAVETTLVRLKHGFTFPELLGVEFLDLVPGEGEECTVTIRLKVELCGCTEQARCDDHAHWVSASGAAVVVV